MNTPGVTLTPLQSMLIATVYHWYANASAIDAGEQAFLTAITNLTAAYPNETDLQVIRGLSLLNVATQVQFQSQTEPRGMLDARVVLKSALAKEANHSGALHYLIHAYDTGQLNTSEQGRPYAFAYGEQVTSLSHAQHMPTHIWLRTGRPSLLESIVAHARSSLGSWKLALQADESSVLASFVLCATKLLNRAIPLVSTQLEPFLGLFNTTSQVSSFLVCDADNRAHSMEWLAFSRLQTGDWKGTVSLLRDLFTAHNRSVLQATRYYLPLAYATQARAIIELFFWFPYSPQFMSRTQELLVLNGTQALLAIGNDDQNPYNAWREAGVRFSECLRCLTPGAMSNFTLMVDGHLVRLSDLFNRTAVSNPFLSTSISIMIHQIRGIRYYLNQSWQACLTELSQAADREMALITDENMPTLTFSRAPELLAMHLLLIYEKSLQRTVSVLCLSLSRLECVATGCQACAQVHVERYGNTDG